MNVAAIHRSPRMPSANNLSNPSLGTLRHHYASSKMKFHSIPISATLFLALSAPSPAADPTWWAARGVTTSSPQSNFSPATIGQAKHMVAMALAELQARLDAPTFQTLQADVAAITSLALPVSPEDFSNQKAVLLSGQLKALARPFYDRLRALDAPWVNRQMALAGILRVEPGSNPLSYSSYPWSVAASDDSNYSPATVGQLKAAFSLHFEDWGLPEPADPPLPSGPYDTDSDGLSDVTEAAIGTSPLLSDSDADGISDATDAFPLDPSRSALLASTPGDLTPPLIALLSPPTATLITGP